jgi:curli production assembly/transport component CsgG
MRRKILGNFAAALAIAMLGGCTTYVAKHDMMAAPPVITPASPIAQTLDALPPPVKKLDVAVYNFPDLTGKNEPNDNVAVLSRAVTQGGAGFVVDGLQRAGKGRWFTVDERTGLNNLLQERQLIRATRAEYEGVTAKPLPPIRFVSLLIEGGILGFDGNTTTGGIGANFLGIGGDTQYREDVVTVGMRVVSVQTGEILTSVTTTKTVYSVALRGNVYKYVATDKLLQAEAGFTHNEPTQLAVIQAIDLAIYATIMEGVKKGLWHFADPAEEAKLVDDYQVTAGIGWRRTPVSQAKAP